MSHYCKIDNETSFAVKDPAKVSVAMYDRRAQPIGKHQPGQWFVDGSGELCMLVEMEDESVKLCGVNGVLSDMGEAHPVRVTVVVEEFEQG